MRPAPKKEKICCPVCHRDSGISITMSTEASVRLPIENGEPAASYEILREPYLAGTPSVLKYSGVDGSTRIVCTEPQGIYLDCPKCGRTFQLPKGTKIECKGAE